MNKLLKIFFPAKEKQAINLPGNSSIWSLDTRQPLTPEYLNNMDIAMGNNWERTCAQLGIITKEFKK